MAPTRAGSPPERRPLLADPDDLMLVFQPIVDLAGATVAGYQALARFPGTAGPDVWTAAAAAAGLGAELEALAVHRALARVPELPPDTFLTVTVSPHLLTSAALQDALGSGRRLDRVVVELGTGGPATEDAAVARRMAALRERGAGIAHEPRHPVRTDALEPDLVVVGRDLLAGLDLTGAVAGRSAARARLLADGLTSAPDLATALRAGAALARGPLTGAPTATFGGLPGDLAALLGRLTARQEHNGGVAALLRPVRQVDGSARGAVAPAVEVGRSGEPLSLILPDARTGLPYSAPVSLTVHRRADVHETLRRALARPPAHRFEPVLCTEADGELVGLLRVEELVAAAARV